MSWQRILETARRRGFPVIVTDIAGREPMVVMPFSEYERLDEVTHEKKIRVVPVMDEPTTTPTVKVTDRMQTEEKVAVATQEAFQRQVDATIRSLADISQVETSPEPGDLHIEERFYLEPLDEETA